MRSDLREVGRPRELGKTSIRDRPISGSKTQRHRVRTADTRPSSARVQEIVLSAIDLEPIRCCADPVFLGQQRKLLFEHLVGQRKKLGGTPTPEDSAVCRLIANSNFIVPAVRGLAHGRVAMAVAIGLGRLSQPGDLAIGEIFPRAKLCVRPPHRCTRPIFDS